MQTEKELLVKLEKEADRRTDRHGIKWFRYQGDKFWQTKDIEKVEKSKKLLEIDLKEASSWQPQSAV